jgi:glycosyltransferase involved in cell wall biosynthesis
MRITLVQPTFQPAAPGATDWHVRDLSISLAARGHDVTVLTGHRRRSSIERHSGVRVVRRWRPPQLRPLSWYDDHVADAPGTVWHLCRGAYDIAHAFSPAAGWAALEARRLGGPPVVFSYHRVATRPDLVRRRYRLEMLEALTREAHLVSVPSGAAARAFRACFGRDPVVLPGGVRVAEPASSSRRAAEPMLLCVALPGDPGDRPALPLRAFELLRRRRPDARLRVIDATGSGGAPARLPPGTEWIDGARAALADELAGAWVSVVPAVEEPSGVPLLASLAAGTPVVATRSGAGPEIVTDERVGRLCVVEDAEAMARSMEEALALADEPRTAAACRRRARDYDWTRIAADYEAAYASLVPEPAG